MVTAPPPPFIPTQNYVWLDRYLPRWGKPYTRLMRLDRPIGTWLLLLPCWWSLALADPRGPDFWLMTLFALGAIIMRGAGCAVNDIYDRDLDRQVERTRTRPLASGVVKPWAAAIFVVLLMLVALRILLVFNRPTIILGILSLLLVFTYPLMKRVTWWPQLFLGLTFNWGALMGWTAVTGTVGTPGILLYVAGIFWTLGYDTIYAYQDIQDDALVGIKSTARLFGDRPKRWVGLFYALALSVLMLAGMAANQHQGFYLIMALVALLTAWRLKRWQPEDPTDCLTHFRGNRDFGLLVLAAIVVGKWL